ncbi:FG-GAP repeat domain-containing protein [Streptomyces sp. NPDC017868]|uniref:FG-GAP repeat domain-containing protein n=1 Tax=Streptomyces sp. NPDC017868 TaxID=3365014 RepID=UPI0037A76808
MNRARTHGRRLAAATVTIVLAATGGMLTTLPATAAPAAAQEAQQTTVPFPRNADVIGAGPSGFLSQTRGATPEFRWTWYADGSSVVLPGGFAIGGGSDLVVTGDGTSDYASRRLTIHNLSTPATAAAAPVEADLDALGGYHLTGLAGSTLLLTREENDHWKQYAATVDGGTLKIRWVLGGSQFECYSGDASSGWSDTGSALYDCWVGEPGRSSKVVVDFGGGNSPMYLQDDNQYAQQGAISATHVAWREMRLSGYGIVAYQRGKSEERWIPSPDLGDPVYLVGGWVATGQKSHIDAPDYGQYQSTRRPFTVQSIGTGGKAVLLTAFSSAVAGPGGSLLVRGGTPEQGEGLYRISPRADGGRPDVELVASTGQSTVITLTGSTTPTTLTGDQLAGGVDFGWDLSRGDASVQVSLTHVRSGQSISRFWPASADIVDGAPRRVDWHWDGKDLERPDGLLSPARAGEYEWRISAHPEEGIGPDLVATGRFTVTRPPAAHDFDDDGTADLLTRHGNGILWSDRSQPVAIGGSVKHAGSTQIGGGWQVYDRLETVGNIAGTTAPDVVARDKDGVLWLYQGTGERNKPFAVRTKIGGGWQVYNELAGGGDLTGDGRADLVATDKAGDLYLYKGTGSATAPFAARKKIGFGWGVYNQLTATGNIAGGPAGDLLARDKAGVLWLYLGKGDGTFAARTKVGAGWGAFTALTAVGDANGDGRADLIAVTKGSTFYAGTGDWRAPFKPGAKTDLTSWLDDSTAF